MIFFDITRKTDTLKTIQQQSLEQPITLFIDEFQEFLRINASIYSDMQRIWDLHKNEVHIIIH